MCFQEKHAGIYALAEPKGSVIEVHEKKIQHQLLTNAGAKLELVEVFKKQLVQDCSKTIAQKHGQNCMFDSS